MSILAAPDGSNQPINNLTVCSFEIPAYAITLLWGWANAAWEQAVVIGVDGVRHAEQLGTYPPRNLVTIGEADHPRTLTLAGWHKRGGPDGGKPWNASRGKTVGDVASWDDSGGDNDFNDYSVRVGFIKPMIKFSFLPVKSILHRHDLERADR